MRPRSSTSIVILVSILPLCCSNPTETVQTSIVSNVTLSMNWKSFTCFGALEKLYPLKNDTEALKWRYLLVSAPNCLGDLPLWCDESQCVDFFKNFNDQVVVLEKVIPGRDWLFSLMDMLSNPAVPITLYCITTANNITEVTPFDQCSFIQGDYIKSSFKSPKVNDPKCNNLNCILSILVTQYGTTLQSLLLSLH